MGLSVPSRCLCLCILSDLALGKFVYGSIWFYMYIYVNMHILVYVSIYE